MVTCVNALRELSLCSIGCLTANYLCVFCLSDSKLSWYSVRCLMVNYLNMLLAHGE